MRTVKLNFESLETREEIQEYLKGQFGFEEYYGNNLDALYDGLTAVTEEMEILFEDEDWDTCCEAVWGAPVRSEEMQNYLKKVIRVIEDAAEENRNLHL